jgi:hypothetical protein
MMEAGKLDVSVVLDRRMRTAVRRAGGKARLRLTATNAPGAARSVVRRVRVGAG